VQSTLTRSIRAVYGLSALVLAAAGAALPATGDFIAIQQKSISLSESGRTGTITVARQGSPNGVSTVQYRFVAQSASADVDFRGVDGTLQWADGESGEQSIEFIVESDLLAEQDETFQIQLFDVSGTQQLGINDSVVVTVKDSACSAVVPASMSGNTVLSEPCYQLNGMSIVGPSGQLSIRPGTTIIAAAQSAITLSGSATLQSEGLASLPIMFKASQDKPGAWNGIALQSTSALHRIGHTEIRNAMNAVNLSAGGFALFNNNILRNTSGAGVMLPMADADTVQTQNTFINAKHGIELVGGAIGQGQTVSLPVQSTHYVLSGGLIIEGTLELAAGTDLRMGEDVPVLVLSTGAISAIGTPDMPINISGVEPRQGFWNGIQYVSAMRSANHFEHVSIAHGGGDPARAGNIIVDGLDTHITMQHCSLNDSAGYGIVLDSSLYQLDLLDVTYAGNRHGEQSL